MHTPDISVCIPVYRSEEYLSFCLKSVFEQDFDNFEIILLSDASDGVDSKGHKAKKILSDEKKLSDKERKKKGLPKIPVSFIENRTNLGTVESRRTLVDYASGKYLLMVDSDDELLSGALKILFESAEENAADIVNANAVFGFKEIFHQEEKDKLNDVINSPDTKFLSGKEILHDFLTQKHPGYLWQKLIKREVYEKAFGHIPYTNCVMADDLLIYFFVALEAEKYISIPKETYLYNLGLGVTSRKTISTLERWSHVCSAANVFTVLYSEIKNLPQGTLSQEEKDSIGLRCRHYIKNNLHQLKKAVASEIQGEAYRMLCDYWGEDFVKEMEEEEKQGK